MPESEETVLPQFTSDELAKMWSKTDSEPTLIMRIIALQDALKVDFPGHWICSVYEYGKGGDTIHLL